MPIGATIARGSISRAVRTTVVPWIAISAFADGWLVAHREVMEAHFALGQIVPALGIVGFVAEVVHLAHLIVLRRVWIVAAFLICVTLWEARRAVLRAVKIKAAKASFASMGAGVAKVVSGAVSCVGTRSW